MSTILKSLFPCSEKNFLEGVKKVKFRFNSKFPSPIKYLKYFQPAQKKRKCQLSFLPSDLSFSTSLDIFSKDHTKIVPWPPSPPLNPPPFVDINARSSSRHETHRLSPTHTWFPGSRGLTELAAQKYGECLNEGGGGGGGGGARGRGCERARARAVGEREDKPRGGRKKDAYIARDIVDSTNVRC